MGEKANMQAYENFILKNIEVDTIPILARFLSLAYEYERASFSSYFEGCLLD